MPENTPLESAEIEWKKKHENFLVELAEMLPPCVADEVNIKLQIKGLLEVEHQKEKLEQKLEKVREDADAKVTTLMGEIQILRSEVERQQKQNETLLNRLEVLETKAKGHQATNFILTTFDKMFKQPAVIEHKTRFGRFISYLQGTYEKKEIS